MKGMSATIDRVGFACVTYSLGLTTNHNFRLSNLNGQKLEKTVERNLDDLEAILGWMLHRGLRFFRIGSSFVPFASHPKMDLDWHSMCGDRLVSVGRKYISLGFRFSMHPGQYNVLNSPNPGVVERTIAELDYSCQVLDLMGLDDSHKVIMHGGGIYRNKSNSLDRLKDSLTGLPRQIKRRIAIENDERNFHFADVARISVQTGVPAVFDWHHHRINSCDNVEGWLQRTNEIWNFRPIIHISSQKPGAKRGAHDLHIHKEDLDELLDFLTFKADLMVEAKSKEIAALKVLQWMDEPRASAEKMDLLA
jgi:UV DNA damage endonuclease